MAETPTIARIWRGRVKAERADEYAAYLLAEGIPPLKEKALAVMQLREDRSGESEFITISFWENVEAMARFTGSDPTKIHHLKRDPEFLIELPETVQVLQITTSKALFGRVGIRVLHVEINVVTNQSHATALKGCR